MSEEIDIYNNYFKCKPCNFEANDIAYDEFCELQQDHAGCVTFFMQTSLHPPKDPK